MAVDRTWRTVDRRYLVDQVVDEAGVAYRVWDAEGLRLAEANSSEQLNALLAGLGVERDEMAQVPVDDPWCE